VPQRGRSNRVAAGKKRRPGAPASERARKVSGDTRPPPVESVPGEPSKKQANRPVKLRRRAGARLAGAIEAAGGATSWHNVNWLTVTP